MLQQVLFQGKLNTLNGSVARITYQGSDTGYTVARFSPDFREGEATPTNSKGTDNLFTVVGLMPGVVAGETLQLSGVWHNHPNYGWQFKIEAYRSVLPATEDGIRKYLGSGLIKGIRGKTADKIVACFGLDTLDVLDNHPERLSEVPKLGKHKAGIVAAAWVEQKAIKEVMVFLQGQGITTSLAVKIYKQYGDASITIVKNDPYRLAREVWGIGFKTADKIALNLGFSQTDPERIKAGTVYVLAGACEKGGHTFLPRPELIGQAAELLGVTSELVETAVDDLVLEEGVILEPFFETGTTASALPGEQAVYLPPFYYAEKGIAANLGRLSNCPTNRNKLSEFKTTAFEVLFKYLELKDSFKLEARQKEGLKLALERAVAVLTGGPGTGKTTSMRALIRVLTLKKKTIVLAAPTGRAAKRLSEATGLEAKTLHRLLALKPGGKAQYDQVNPIPADIVIVDEASMLDTLLMNTLLKAIATGTHLLLVGDADQLPSVGAGNVLADIIRSGVVPVVRLEQIFRQGAGSAIVTNAHLINQGEMPVVGREVTDFFFFTEGEAVAERVIDLVAKRIPAKFGYKPEEIQVLSPMHRGMVGVGYLNEKLQEVLNPAREGKREKQFGGRIYRVGDKVLQLRNNYEKDVFNGDGGVIVGISHEDQEVKIRLEDGREVGYEFSELDELNLAYAMSIHKSQGSEYGVCVIPVVMGHFMLLQRQLIYTAVTRAKKLVVLVGSKKALAIAVKNGPEALGSRAGRYTGLAVRLSQRA